MDPVNSVELDQDDVRALLAVSHDDRIRLSAAAWLHAYNLAHWLAFTEETARVQAGYAWDDAVQDLAAAAAIDLVDLAS